MKKALSLFSFHAHFLTPLLNTFKSTTPGKRCLSWQLGLFSVLLASNVFAQSNSPYPTGKAGSGIPGYGVKNIPWGNNNAANTPQITSLDPIPIQPTTTYGNPTGFFGSDTANQSSIKTFSAASPSNQPIPQAAYNTNPNVIQYSQSLPAPSNPQTNTPLTATQQPLQTPTLNWENSAAQSISTLTPNHSLPNNLSNPQTFNTQTANPAITDPRISFAQDAGWPPKQSNPSSQVNPVAQQTVQTLASPSPAATLDSQTDCVPQPVASAGQPPIIRRDRTTSTYPTQVIPRSARFKVLQYAGIQRASVNTGEASSTEATTAPPKTTFTYYQPDPSQATPDQSNDANQLSAATTTVTQTTSQKQANPAIPRAHLVIYTNPDFSELKAKNSPQLIDCQPIRYANTAIISPYQRDLTSADNSLNNNPNTVITFQPSAHSSVQQPPQPQPSSTSTPLLAFQTIAIDNSGEQSKAKNIPDPNAGASMKALGPTEVSLNAADTTIPTHENKHITSKAYRTQGPAAFDAIPDPAVRTGKLRCSLKVGVSFNHVYHKNIEQMNLRWLGKNYLMKQTQAQAGFLRWEHQSKGLAYIQTPFYGFLLDTKKRQRLADSCFPATPPELTHKNAHFVSKS